jgi:hypothetical protein
MGEVPTWYRVVKAAQFLGTSPWDLSKQPLTWLFVAEEAQSAEAHAEKMHEKRRKSGIGSG